MKYKRLLLEFDRHRLRADLDRIDEREWAPHFNAGYYDGEWSGVALRAVEGALDSLYPDPTAPGRFVDTPILQRTPYLRSVLAAFACPLNSVRLLKLTAGSNIQEHRDYQLNHARGEVRIHVPIATNDDVAFFLDGELVPMAEGEAWYLDLELPHRVYNNSREDRVHLVIDCTCNDWLDALLDPGVAASRITHHVSSTAGQVRRNTKAELQNEIAATIAAFLRSIGIVVATGAIDARGAVPGVQIERGVLVVDESRLAFPGDLLHEAGHLAVADPARRTAMTGDAASDGGEEMAAIAWSYAACLHIGVDPAVVFHSEGYRGGSAAILENFAEGRYFGVPLLQWFGMTRAEEYPVMSQWIRPEGLKIA
jgi:hypothetical protein